MKELVVISGKGGTGKTSVVASLAALAKRPVLADCDVDAADLHLVLEPTVERREEFSGGSRARILPEKCVACGRCAEVCRFGAICVERPGSDTLAKTYRVDPIGCEGCGVCAWFCPAGAIEFLPAVNGEWLVSTTRFGPMVHARLGVAEENSGKLVTRVRKEAAAIAERDGHELLLVDGSPGIGCPVIASLTGADAALIVTEPTLSGLHDLERVAQVARGLGIETMIAINKHDLNDEIAGRIERLAVERGLAVVGRIRYDGAVTDAQRRRQTVVEYGGDGAAADIEEIWRAVMRRVAA